MLQGITFVLLVLQIFAPLAYEGLVLYWKNSMNKLKVCSYVLSYKSLLQLKHYTRKSC